MRIGMIVENEFVPDMRVEREALALKQAGNEVEILAFSYGILPLQEEYKGLKIIRFRVSKFFFNKLAPLALTVPFYFWKWKRPLKHFVSKRFDVIHLHDIPLIKPVLKLKNQFNFKLIVDLHENRPEIMKLYSHIYSLPGRLLISIKKWEEYQKKYLPHADGIIVVTERAKEQLLKDITYPVKNVVSVTNTLDISSFQHIPKNVEIVEKFSQTWNIVYVGVTGKRRGLETVLKAMAHLKNTYPNIRFIIVGASRDDQELKKLSQILQISDKVFWAGWVKNDEINSYIQASQVGISPLVRNPHHDTTMANKIVQYLALGKPILVSDCPAQVDIVKKYRCGFIFQDGAAEELCEKIIELYKDKKLYDQLSRNALMASKALDWQNEQKKLISSYQNLFSNNPEVLPNFEREYYEEEFNWNKLTLNKWLQQKSEVIRSCIPSDVKTIADIGCGNGIITNSLGKNFRIIGLDRSLTALKGFRHIKIGGDIRYIPLKRSSIEFVLSSEVLEHLPGQNLKLAVSELKRISRKYILITVPNGENLNKNLIKCPACKKTFNISLHFHSFNPEVLKQLFPEYKMSKVFRTGKPVRQYNNLLLFIRQRVGNVWGRLADERKITCPQCGMKFMTVPQKNIISIFCDGLNLFLARRRPYWLGVLFEKK
ncbi:MAG: hypothetical protein Kow0042_08920 [Calditrichia bacterium]